MKVKNIVFSGFAAAILMGTANAATPFRIASQAYVDQQITNLSGANGAISEVASDVETLAGQIAGANETITNDLEATTVVGAINELAGDVAAAATAASNAGTAASAAQDDIDALEDAVGSGFSAQNTVADAIDAKQNKLGGTNDAGKVVTATATAGDVTYTAIDTTIGAQGTSNLITSAAVKAYVDNAIDGVSGTTGSIATQIGTALGDLGTGNTTVEDALADKQDNLSQTELDSITAAAALLAAGYNTCISQANGSGHCVLSASSTGLEWIDVTSPFEIQ